MADVPVDPLFSSVLLLVRGTDGFQDVGPLSVAPIVEGATSVSAPGAGWINAQVLRTMRGSAQSRVRYQRPGGWLPASARSTWTIECWISLDAPWAPVDFPWRGWGYHAFLAGVLSAAGVWDLGLQGYSGAPVQWGIGNTGAAYGLGSLVAGQRTHLAVVSTPAGSRSYVNGVLAVDLNGQPTALNFDEFRIGKVTNASASNEPQAYMEEIRFTAAARYTGNFTPPQQPFYGTDMAWPAGSRAWPGGVPVMG